MFWRKTPDTNKNTMVSDEYRKCLDRFAEINSDVALLKAEIKILQTECDNLRGNFNRKLKALVPEEKKQEEKDINNTNEIYLG